VLYLLQRQPVQGKAALDRLTAELDSRYFPRAIPDAVEHFQHGPLARPRDSLIRNFGVIILKTVLLGEEKGQPRQRYLAALGALRTMHRQPTEQLLAERLPDILRRVPHDRLWQVLLFLQSVTDVWDYVPPDVQNIIRRYVAAMPSEDIAYLDTALMLPFLRAEAARRARSLTEQEFGEFLPWDLDSVVWDRAITIYLASKSFDAANRRVELLTTGANELSKEQIERLIRGAAENIDVKQSFGFPGLIRKIRASSQAITHDELNALLEDSGLIEYVDEEDEEEGEGDN
jgi:hypothetical protein